MRDSSVQRAQPEALRKTRRRASERADGAAAYREALAELPDRSPLEALIVRTLQAGAQGADPTGLAIYVARCWDLLSGADTTALLEKDAPWPQP